METVEPVERNEELSVRLHEVIDVPESLDRIVPVLSHLDAESLVEVSFVVLGLSALDHALDIETNLWVLPGFVWGRKVEDDVGIGTPGLAPLPIDRIL